MKKIYTIREFESFVTVPNPPPGCKTLPKSCFDALEQLLDSDQVDSSFMALSIRRGLGHVLTARNYVGVIALKDGSCIEILPKIVSAEETDDKRARALLIQMLRTLRTAPFKSIQIANLGSADLPLLECFIRMFLDGLLPLAQRGLKRDYSAVEENQSFFRGKLVVSEQIRHNAAHRERFFIRYDEYRVDCPENRLIKSALELLYRFSASEKNRSDLRLLLNIFEQVPGSNNIQADFSKIVTDRFSKDYQQILAWCKVFLEGQSFETYAGNHVAFALLFPMETLFESYVASWMRRCLAGRNVELLVQEQTHSLFSNPEAFPIRPDLVLKKKDKDKDKESFPCDTKWKLLDGTPPSFGISQADMYQMLAYQKCYQAKSVTLLYPRQERFSTQKLCFSSGDDGQQILVRFVDLMEIESSMQEILCDILD